MTGNFRKMSGEPSESNGSQGQDNKAMDHMESIGENIWFWCDFMQFYVGKSIYIIEFFIELVKYLVSKFTNQFSLIWQYMSGSLHILVTSFLVFYHFSCVIFFKYVKFLFYQSCLSCLAKCKQRLHNFFIFF